MTHVEPDGTLHLEALDLPPSGGWSEQARRVFMRRFSGPTVSVNSIRGLESETEWLASAREFRSGMERLHRHLLARIEADHPSRVEEDTLNGVPIRWVTPLAGVAPENAARVLVNLHGGAFVGGSEHCGLVESLPIATTGGYRICVVDYRQGWEHRFPSASEDVAGVFSALCGTYSPEQIGLFGYSAGGMLAAQATAWLLTHDLAVPGAIALCSSGAGGSGDSTYLASAAMGQGIPSPNQDSNVALGGHDAPARFGYAAGVDPRDPLLAPIHAPDLLGGFPPTLVLTGSRSFDLSSALLTHRALLASGTDAELHAWEGMWHCFPYNHHMPEAKDAFGVISRFFDRHLAG